MADVAIVTGAGAGIGDATVKRLVTRGVSVVGVGRSSAPESDTLTWAESDRLVWVQGDVSDDSTWDKVQSKLDSRRWEPTILVPVAAYLEVGDALSLTDEQWQRTFDVNVFGLLKPVRLVLPGMIRRGRGSIVTVGSIDSYFGEQGLISYCTSKGAILQFTRALALDHARAGIRVNCVCAGVTDTKFFRRHLDTASDPQKFLSVREQRNPIGRLLKPDEVAAAIVFLASDDASGITGTGLMVDGGLTTGFDFRTGNEGA